MATPLKLRVQRWLQLATAWGLKRVLLHPNAKAEAQKLWPTGQVEGLPIQYLGGSNG